MSLHSTLGKRRGIHPMNELVCWKCHYKIYSKPIRASEFRFISKLSCTGKELTAKQLAESVR